MRAKHIARKIIEKLREGPAVLLSYGLPFLRGMVYALYFRVFTKNVRIKLPFYVHDRVHISGPGKVFIDWGCHARALSFDRLRITTLSPEAEVRIGRRCNLGPLIIRCRNRITLGAEVLSANCVIQDTSSLTRDSDTAPITIGDGVWLSDMTMVLGGSSIGAHSVLSRGSVCHRMTAPDNSVLFGNPVFGVLDAARLDTLMRASA